jgi:hypothetical protein
LQIYTDDEDWIAGDADFLNSAQGFEQIGNVILPDDTGNKKNPHVTNGYDIQTRLKKYSSGRDHRRFFIENR